MKKKHNYILKKFFKKGINVKLNDLYECSKIIDFFVKNKIYNLKYGIDVTKSYLHFGHIIILSFLFFLDRNIKKIKINIVLGNFTTLIGDPSGKKKKRKFFLNIKNIKKNCYHINNIISNIFKNNRFNLVYNQDWLNKLKLVNFLNICKKIPIKDIVNRKVFKNRKEKIMLNEIIYPLFQAYDSFYLNTQLEIGGIDQLFNLKMGRILQKNMQVQIQRCILISLLKNNKDIKIGKSNKNVLQIKNFTTIQQYNNFFSIIMKWDINILKYISNILNLFFEYDNIIIKDIQNKNIYFKMDIVLNIMKILFKIDKNYQLKIKNNFLQKFILKENYIKLETNNNTNLLLLLKKIFFNKSNNFIKKYIKHSNILINNILEKNYFYILKNNDKLQINKYKKFIVKINN